MVAPVRPIHMEGQENLQTRSSWSKRSFGASDSSSRHPRHESLLSKDEPREAEPSIRRPLQPIESSKPKTAGNDSPSFHLPTDQRKPVRRALLRYGEQMESLFGITDRVSQSYITDCRHLVENEDDQVLLWRRVLDYASRNKVLGSADLVRLHRRATARLPASSDCHSEADQDHLLAIWLSYAQAQMQQGVEKEARLTLQHIRSWASHKAALFLHLARMEIPNSPQKAITIIQEGINSNAQPIGDLHTAMAKLQKSKEPTKKRKPGQQLSPKRPQPLSPKRMKTENGRVDVLPQTEDVKSESPSGVKGSIRFQHPGPRRSNGATELNKSRAQHFESDQNRELQEEQKNPAAVTQHSTDSTDSTKQMGRSSVDAEQESRESQTLNKLVKATPGRSEEETQGARLRSAGSTKVRRPPLFSSRLGKARRVDPTVGNRDESDDDESVQIANQEADTSEPIKTELPRLDLSYILEWNPNKCFPNENKPQPDPIEAKPKPSKHPGQSEAGLAVSQKSIPTETARKPRAPEVASNEDKESPSESSHTRVRDQVNSEFAHLLQEKNIMRINGVPYVKLGGPVGKGGSCKVYRALAKDNSVVAIKKVKIAGMDRKAIQSYANEINLLKSLRGRSTIIQMFDSEVDIQRKAIFVVMELGEADLSHALQKQALAASERGRPCINMNFIRLTWQQMLSAVHCIHEERIVHGDLKPANFLFVKGTLKLIDFGIAKAIEHQDTTNIYRESQIGTLNYMSPEAILDSGANGNKPLMKIGRASDIWSLGCILYQMVYGKTPFAELYMIQKLQAITNPDHEINFPNTADPLAVDVMKQCLQRKPDLRPPIVGKNGLLNEHPFLVTRTMRDMA